MRVSFDQAVNLLEAGNVLAIPTETVYGLAAEVKNSFAVEKIFLLKKRPRSNPLIIHIAHKQDLQDYVTHFPPGFEALAEAFWPGPLTCILPINEKVIPDIVRANLRTVAFRIPDFALTRELIERTGPLVMPSANLSGSPSSTRPEHIENDFGKDFPVLDGGICLKGVESTIVIYQEGQWRIIRQGALSAEQFQPILGYLPPIIEKIKGENPLCPGQLFRHYAPKARLILGDRAELFDVSFILGFKERSYPSGKRLIILGSLSNPEEVAENLYHALRQLDEEEASLVWVDMDFPKGGLWQTIAERLRRAGE